MSFTYVRRLLAHVRAHDARVVSSVLWVALFVLIAKFAGAAKEMTLASRYGVGETTDAYVFVFNFISWPISVSMKCTLTLALTPVVAHLRHNHSPAKAASPIRGEMLGLVLVGSVVLSVAAACGLPLILHAQWAGLTDGALSKALAFSVPFSVLIPLGLTTALFSVWLLACGRHINTLIEGVPSLILTGALLVPSEWFAEPLLWGRSRVSACSLWFRPWRSGA